MKKVLRQYLRLVGRLESSRHVPAPQEVRFPEYSILFEVLRRFAYSGDGKI
jgi:hypothetical protein